MQIVIVLQLKAAQELQQRKSCMEPVEVSTEVKELLHAAEELGIRLEPIHPGQTNQILMPFFAVEVPTAETAERVVKQLSQLKAVEGAYLKPPAELP